MFLHALLHCGSIDLPTFICHHILRAFTVPGHRIGLPYIYLIHRLVTSLRTTFPDGVSRQVSYPRGQVTISQSRSHVPLSSTPTVLAKPADSSCQLILLVIFSLVVPLISLSHHLSQLFLLIFYHPLTLFYLHQLILFQSLLLFMLIHRLRLWSNVCAHRVTGSHDG